jgi:ATP-binding cassette subfamily B (MDR/TAP) protein 1
MLTALTRLRLLASREYDAVQFFVVYIAIVNGAESAGSFMSFGPSKSATALTCLPLT